LAVIGGGWAGLAAAVEACQRGHQVSLFEMAPQLGGRARSLPMPSDGGPALDNGQHILIGAYTQSLRLMALLGVEPERALLRLPLRLRYPRHEGLRLPPGWPLLSFARGVLQYDAWPLSARIKLLGTAGRWLLQRFACAPQLSVAQLCAGLPPSVMQDLIAPLCVAALNTPASQASAQVFLRVLRDALFSGRGSSDLLLPRLGLSDLLAEPARRWLTPRGADLQLGRRVQSLLRQGSHWRVDGQLFDAVILACPSGEAARLGRDINPDWAARAQALCFEPIITVYLHCPGAALPAPMLTLQESAQAPAQFAFDLGQLDEPDPVAALKPSSHRAGLFAFVVSGAASWVARGLTETGAAVLAQAQRELDWPAPPTLFKVLAEKRATFACTPGLQRPPAHIAEGLWAAGDYVAGPYPATLEGAVRSGLAAVHALTPTTP
jgi:squalene-associated FAD-dependent desaturase